MLFVNVLFFGGLIYTFEVDRHADPASLEPGEELPPRDVTRRYTATPRYAPIRA